MLLFIFMVKVILRIVFGPFPAFLPNFRRQSYKPSWLFVKTDENPIVRQEHPIFFRSCIDFSDINPRSFVPYVCHLLLLTCYRLPYSDFYSLQLSIMLSISVPPAEYLLKSPLKRRGDKESKKCLVVFPQESSQGLQKIVYVCCHEGRYRLDLIPPLTSYYNKRIPLDKARFSLYRGSLDCRNRVFTDRKHHLQLTRGEILAGS